MDPRMKILIVDDTSTKRRIYRNLFKQLGYNNIEEADNGQKALQMLREDKFDFVISDDDMPLKDGLRLLKDVRADDKLKALPFIILLATADKDKVIAAKEAGVNNYIVPPFNADTLKKKMDETYNAF